MKYEKNHGAIQGLKVGGIISITILLGGATSECYSCACDACGYGYALGGMAMLVSGIISIITVSISVLIGLLYGKIKEDNFKKANGLETTKERKKRLKEQKNRNEVLMFKNRIWDRYNQIKNSNVLVASMPQLRYSNNEISESVLVNQEKFNMQIMNLAKTIYILEDKEKALYDDIMENLSISAETIKKYIWLC